MSQTIDREHEIPRDGEGNPIAGAQAVANSYAFYLSPAFAGMKGDAMDDNVDTFACAVPTGFGFGIVVGRTAPHLKTIHIGGTDPVGISLHDHLIASRGQYMQYDAVSVMTRGRGWCQVLDADASAVDDGVYVTFDAATGQVGSVTGTKLPAAVFRSKAVAVYDITYTNTTNIALVELHYPFAVPGP